MQNLTGQTSADAIDPAEWNHERAEIEGLVTIFQTLSGADSTQLRKAIANAVASFNYYTAGGSASAITLAPIGGKPATSQLIDGQIARFRPTANSVGGGTTLNYNSTGAIALVREDGSAIQANDLDANHDVWVEYDASNTRWFLIRAFTSTLRGNLPPGHIDGLTLGRDPGDTNRNTTIRVAVGNCRSADDTEDIALTGTLDKEFGSAFVAGAGGGFSGTRTAGAWYRVFIIKDVVNGTVDVGFDNAAAANAANLITAADTAHSGSGNWVYRQLGWVRAQTANSSLFQPFRNDPSDPDLFLYAGGGDNCGRSTRTLSASYSSAAVVAAPPDSIAMMGLEFDSFAASTPADLHGWITDTDSSLATPGANSGNVHLDAFSPGDSRVAYVEAKTNASSQLQFDIEQSAYVTDLAFWCMGFRWRR